MPALRRPLAGTLAHLEKTMSSTKPMAAAPAAPLPTGSGTPSNETVDDRPPKEDNVLESLGKAITDPITTAAAEEEPDDRGLPPVTPGG